MLITVFLQNGIKSGFLYHKRKEKTLASSILQRKYGVSFLRAFNILTIKREPKKKEIAQTVQTNFSTELPFNQFKYNTDFIDASKLFFF